MAYKIYGANINTFWENGQDYPQDHVENLANPPRWYEMNKKFEWQSPEQQGWLITKVGKQPKYLKLTDGKMKWYFFCMGLDETIAVDSTGEFNYRYLYILDKYMTYQQELFTHLLNFDPSVRFINKFYDRFLYTTDSYGFISTAEINFYKQIQYTKMPNENYIKVRNYVYGTNPLEMFNINFPGVTPPATYNAQLWSTTTPDTIPVSWSSMITPNSNNRFLYLVAKSSSLISNKVDNPQTHCDNTKILIPIFTGQEDNIYDRLNNFDPSVTYTSLLDASGDNGIGFYESEIPFALIAQSNPNNIFYAKNNASGSATVVFFKFPHNKPFDFKIVDFNNYTNGLQGRLKNIIVNSIYEWTPDTEPLFLSPSMYLEKHQLDSNNILMTDMSMIDYNIDATTLDTTGLEMRAYFGFDSVLSATYNYGNYTLTTNPMWNTNYSNRNIDASLSAGLYNSASSSYYTTNSTTQYTSIANRKSEETQAWTDYGFATAKNVIDIGTASANMANPVTWIAGKGANEMGKAAKAALNIAQGAVDTALTQQRANRSLMSQRMNLATSPSNTASSPYVNVYVPSISINNNYLWNTYCEELADYEKIKLFMKIAQNGYDTDEYAPLSTFLNRVYMNPLYIDINDNYSEIWNLIKRYSNPYFNTKNYLIEFLSWLIQPKRFWYINTICNCFDYTKDDYVSNIERTIAPLPTPKININTIITVTNLTTILPSNYTQQDVKDAIGVDNTIPDGFWNEVDLITNNDTFIVESHQDSAIYYGNVKGTLIISSYVTYYNSGTSGDTTTIKIIGFDSNFAALLSNNGNAISTITFPTPSGNVKIQKQQILGIGFVVDGTLTSIPDYFLYYCTSFNKPLILPPNITRINDNFLQDCRSFNQPLTLPNSLTLIDTSFMSYCTSFNQPLTLPNSITSISILFMQNCTSFNQPLTLPNSLTLIDSSFMYGCKSFNQPLTLPNNLTSIRSSFMFGCTSFNQPLTLPNTLISIGAVFMTDCTGMYNGHNTVDIGTLDATIFTADGATLADEQDITSTQGIIINGTNKADFLARFPNSTSTPYRKLVAE